MTKVMQENTYAGVSVLMKLQAACMFNRKRLRHKCLTLKFANISRTRILLNICEGLLLRLALLCVNRKRYLHKTLTRQKANQKDLVVEIFFFRVFLKLEVNISFAKYAASSVFKRFTKVKVGKLYKL